MSIFVNVFLGFKKWVDPKAGTAVVGELSVRSYTYFKEIALCKSTDDYNVTYLGSYNKTSGLPVARNSDDFDLEVIQSFIGEYYKAIEVLGLQSQIDIKQHMLNSLSMLRTPISSDQLAIDLQYPVTAPDNKVYFGRVDFIFTNNSSRTYRVWCSDEILRNTYDYTQYVVVPQLKDLNSYWLTPVQVRDQIDKADAYEHAQRAQDSAGIYPCTSVNWVTYNYIDPNNTVFQFPVKWAVLAYGDTIDTDSIKKAIATHLLKGPPQKTTAQWKSIFPDVFTTTSFVLNPLWDEIAIAGLVVGQTGIYKNNLTIREILEKAYLKYPEFNQIFISNNLHYLPMPYKSIGVLSMPGSENAPSRNNINTLYPDIINVTSGQADYNRMSTKTQAFLDLLGSALAIAETATSGTPMPVKYFRSNYNAQTYVGFNHEGATFHVKPKNVIA